MRHLATRTLTVALLFGLLAACSTDTPTAPQRTPAPPPGSGAPSAVWNITVTTNQSSLAQSAAQPATIGIRVRRAGDGQVPPEGATIVVSANLGDFNEAGSGERTATLALNRDGLAQVLYFAGEVLGIDVIEAELEQSFGQVLIEIVEPLLEVVASFLVDNPDGNRSVRFVNTSTGDPTSFFWDFGDGTTSTEVSPSHIYASGGTYFVQLTASKPGSSSTASMTVTLAEDPDPDALSAAFSFVVNGLEVLFFDESSGCATGCTYTWFFGDGTPVSTATDPTHLYAAAGTYTVTLRVVRGTESSTSVQGVTVP